MKVMYYSDVLDKMFTSEEALQQAEQEALEAQKKAKAAKDERARRAKEVEDAIEHANDLMSKFIDDYGSFHRTTTHDNNWLAMILSLFD